MEGLVEISGCDRPQRRIDVVFVHGLDGDARTTWHPKDKPKDFWPAWLGSEFPDAGIWSLDYEARSLAWKGHSMPLYERAKNTLDRLELAGIGQLPIGFVCHSLGGLLIKQVLRLACEFRNERWQAIAEQTAFIVFLATPHSGADMATWIQYLGLLLRPMVSVKELEQHDPALRQLNDWCRDNVAELRIRTTVYCEAQPTKGIMVVNETTANPGIPGVHPIPLDADHVTICKPESKNAQVYQRVAQLLSEVMAIAGDTQHDALQSASSGRKDFTMNELESAHGTTFPGGVKLVFCDRLGGEWRKLADLLEIPASDQARFERGDEARAIWEWLDRRMRLAELSECLVRIGRKDLAEELKTHPR